MPRRSFLGFLIPFGRRFPPAQARGFLFLPFVQAPVSDLFSSSLLLDPLLKRKVGRSPPPIFPRLRFSPVLLFSLSPLVFFFSMAWIHGQSFFPLLQSFSGAETVSKAPLHSVYILPPPRANPWEGSTPFSFCFFFPRLYPLFSSCCSPPSNLEEFPLRKEPFIKLFFHSSPPLLTFPPISPPPRVNHLMTRFFQKSCVPLPPRCHDIISWETVPSFHDGLIFR